MATPFKIVLEKVRALHGDKFTLTESDYVNSKTPISVHCNICGYDWKPRPDRLTKINDGSGCPGCSGKAKITFDQFRKRIQDRFGDVIEFKKDSYKSVNKTVDAKCKTCDYAWSPIPNNLFRESSNGCPRCSGQAIKTFEMFVEDIKEIHGDAFEFDKNTYTKVLDTVSAKCKTCNHTWKAIPHSMLRKDQPAGCSKCSGHVRKTFKMFVEEVKEVHGDVFEFYETTYRTTQKRVRVKCKVCNHEWEPIALGFLRKDTPSGCPKCAGNAPKTPEEIIEMAIKKHGATYEYVKDSIINTQKKMKIICKKHGPFMQAPNAHISRGNGCPSCKTKNEGKVKKLWKLCSRRIFQKTGTISSTGNQQIKILS